MADPLLSVASSVTLSVYDIDIEIGMSLMPTTTRTPATLIAQWPCPTAYEFASIALAPDASILAAITHRRKQTAAVILLHPRTCSMLMRIALPAFFSYSSSPIHGHRSATFVSASPGMLASNAPPLDALPRRLRDVLAEPPPPSLSAAAAAAATVWNDVAPWALAIASNDPAKYSLLISLRRGYRRVHHITHLVLPVSPGAKMNAMRRLDREREACLGLQTDRSLFRLVNTSFDQIIAHADVPLHTVLACDEKAAVATCVRANSALAVAALNDTSLMLIATNIQVAEVRAANLICIPKFGSAVVIVTSLGFPFIIASVSLKRRISLPQLRIVNSHEAAQVDDDDNDQDEWSCSEDAAVALMFSGDSIIAAYAKGQHVIVRVTMPKHQRSSR